MDDLISRQALLDAFGFSEKTRKYGGDDSGYETLLRYEVQDIIEDAPTAYPKKGKWKHISDLNFMCSECGWIEKWSRYCPNCGARMEEPYDKDCC